MRVTRERNNRGIVGIPVPRVDICVDGVVATVPLAELGVDHLRACEPIREVSWRNGQLHLPGYYWCATMGSLVLYESRLELARLWLADFDPTVVAIYAQPFTLSYRRAAGGVARHTPDFALLAADGGVRVVDVKPAEMLGRTEVVQKLSEADAWLESVAGFDVEFWTGEAPEFLANLQFLARYRNPALFNSDDTLTAAARVGASIAIRDAEALLQGAGMREPRPVLLHLLWSHWFTADLSRPLGPETVLELP